MPPYNHQVNVKQEHPSYRTCPNPLPCPTIACLDREIEQERSREPTGRQWLVAAQRRPVAAAMNGTPSTREECAEPVSISGLKLSAFHAVGGRCTRINITVEAGR
jgi:hypothetical protein